MTRFATMNSNVRLAAAAAIVVALVGVGAFAFLNNSNIAAPATPSPSLGASPSAAAGGSARLPEALKGRWVGVPRVVPEMPEPPARNALLLSNSQLSFALAGQGSATAFASGAALIAPDQLRLIGATTDGGCKPRDAGTYSFILDASGTVLTLTPISDACAPRAAALTGGWTHVGCTEEEGWCLGDLAAGTHSSTIFTPLVPPQDWQYDYGRFSYTVPAGWANTADCPACYALAKQGAPENDAVYFFADIVPHSQDESCPELAEPGVGRTASAITDWLTSLPGLDASAPEPVTVGGLPGFSVDLTLAAAWTHGCDYSDGKPIVSTFVDSDDSAEGFDWNVGAVGKVRYIILDLGDGRALLIDIEVADIADFDGLVADAMPVIGTFTFRK
jgi:hypothetical protein